MAADRELIDEQIAYYRARASEYDATSTVEGDPFAEHSERIRDAIRAFDPRGRVIELAAGTGQWTGLLADHADTLVVTDASPEMLDLNRAKVGQRGIRYEVADAFALPAMRDFDVAFFGFFLSHVPESRFDALWGVIDGLLAAGGRAFFVDEADHGLWEEDWLERDGGIVRRTLLDGTQHRAVKILWKPQKLEQRIRQLGLDASVTAEGPFYWGTAGVKR